MGLLYVREAGGRRYSLRHSDLPRAKDYAETRSADLATRPERTVPGRQAVLYVVQAGEAGPVKIGISTNFRKRLRDLRESSGEPLRVVALYRLLDIERAVHWKLRAHNRVGEWFNPGAIDAIQDLLPIRLPSEFRLLTERSQRAVGQ